eukprot:CAMPEP_0170502218 /NCGR_PEP_ID=MMETSP0208-20121228/40826_1 /TAXON_ID=197538 /ORGANISM="Strombidium inclinatum, Strain S3" /LENGTH=141 /DNA_ID=CAMNT_0010781163 /DNA_START=40 /DNA_END=465 /DNA_ORIENTATION=-
MNNQQYGPPADHTEAHRPTSFDDIKGAILDSEGTFKYIQIEVTDPASNQTRTVVRGYKSCPYHADILNKFQYEELSTLGPMKFNLNCPGGGRITHTNTAADHKIHIYGYSQGFGLADHQKSENIIAQDYNGYEFTWTNEGY